ncbi:tyrosine-protein phosphatase [Alienimonas chondri]|uniref:Tyrosine specific protein phosphatases domain-containing protein n=1 Tax=Alienimonas chondri TaxID=2681879 RepID=A0ABX1VB72_9PLAN|nr:tyrosine-protein phosphatase [Alienimonas chondri]NNJ24934.1 hypothetical protein [Alienimonas chondri]
MKTHVDPARRFLYPLAFGGAAAACGLHATRGGLWWALLWPAAAFAGVATIYLAGRPGWFGKRSDGSRNPVAAAFFAPYTLFALAAWHAHRRLGGGGGAWDRLEENLFLSRRPMPGEFPSEMKSDEEAVILDLTAEFRDPRAVSRRPGYQCRPILDAAAPDAAALGELVSVLPPPGGPPALVHCANGRGRTGLIAAAWLLSHGRATTAADAVDAVTAARPDVRLLPRQRATLEAFADLRTDFPSTKRLSS